MKYAWLREHHEEYSTAMMCELLSVSRSGLHQAATRGPSARRRDEGESSIRFGEPRSSTAAALLPEERKELKADGLLVEQASGAAAAAGIQQGDVILAFNGESVKNVDQLKKLIDKAKGKVAILVQRENTRIYVPVNIGGVSRHLDGSPFPNHMLDLRGPSLIAPELANGKRPA